MKRSSKYKTFLIKALLNAIYVILLIILLALTSLPSKFDNEVYYENFKFNSWLCLLLYRMLVYIIYPFIVTIIEKVFLKRNDNFKNLIIDNFNIQFFSYAFISALYVIIGLDKILGVTAFDSSDAFIFIGGFIVTLILKNDFPKIFFDNDAK